MFALFYDTCTHSTLHHMPPSLLSVPRRYLLFAAEPYETIAFKIPALEVDRDPSKFFTHWDEARKTFVLQLHFRVAAPPGGGVKRPLE